MMTVLPTPAPPKMPTLPPFLNGQIRSMILRPVSKTSTSVDCSSNGGASRWMGRVVVTSTGPLLSIGRPRTSNTRPRVASPTGTEIGAPVSRTSTPRARPSVVVIATDRTQLLPRCCCTSHTSESWPSRRISTALQDRRQLPGGELDVHDGAGDLDDPTVGGRCGGRHGWMPPASVCVSGRWRPTRSRSSRG